MEHEVSMKQLYGQFTSIFCQMENTLPIFVTFTHYQHYLIFEKIEKVHSNEDDNDKNVKVIHDFLNVLAIK